MSESDDESNKLVTLLTPRPKTVCLRLRNKGQYDLFLVGLIRQEMGISETIDRTSTIWGIIQVETRVSQKDRLWCLYFYALK